VAGELHSSLFSMKILVSNDDGVYSPGIASLAEVASEFGIVRVVAPDVERSSMGHAIMRRGRSRIDRRQSAT
jgi:5'/3'-nucleotidase SurE